MYQITMKLYIKRQIVWLTKPLIKTVCYIFGHKMVYGGDTTDFCWRCSVRIIK